MSPKDKTVRYFYPCGDIFARGADSLWVIFPSAREKRDPKWLHSNRNQIAKERGWGEGGSWRKRRREVRSAYDDTNERTITVQAMLMRE